MEDEMITVNSKRELFEIVVKMLHVNVLKTVDVLVLDTSEGDVVLQVGEYDMTPLLAKLTLNFDEYTNKSVVQHKHWDGTMHDTTERELLEVGHAVVSGYNSKQKDELERKQRVAFYEQLGAAAKLAGHTWSVDEKDRLLLNDYAVNYHLSVDTAAVSVTNRGQYNPRTRREEGGLNKRFPKKSDGTFNVAKIVDELAAIVRANKVRDDHEAKKQTSEQLAEVLRQELALTWQSGTSITASAEPNKVLVTLRRGMTADQARALVKYFDELTAVKV
jgi:hypothetical protein